MIFITCSGTSQFCQSLNTKILFFFCLQEDLVLLGARYAPCMRRDERLFNLIEQDRIKESMSGCCIRNDGSGCVQMNSRIDCLVSCLYCYDITSSPSRDIVEIAGVYCLSDTFDGDFNLAV